MSVMIHRPWNNKSQIFVTVIEFNGRTAWSTITVDEARELARQLLNHAKLAEEAAAETAHVVAA